jgi:putative glycosyltransferase
VGNSASVAVHGNLDEHIEVSVVSTLYRSAPQLEEFYRRCVASAERLGRSFEIVLVNDGSPDTSLAVAIDLHRRDRRVRVVDLARNFGHHRAMMTGLRYARGQRVFLIDSDLEVAPELLIEFDEAFTRERVDVVYGVQATRNDSRVNRLSADAFYGIFNRLSSFPIPKNLVTTRLMSRRYVQALVAHQERELVIAGLWAMTGFKQLPVLVEKSWKGKTSYGFARRASLLVNAVFSFSNRPLELIFWLGAACLLAALAGAAYLVIRWAFFGGFLVGWASVVVSIWLFGGLMMVCLGTIGFYVGKIFIETKQRPYVIVRDIYEGLTSEVSASSAGRAVQRQASDFDPHLLVADNGGVASPAAVPSEAPNEHARTVG